LLGVGFVKLTAHSSLGGAGLGAKEHCSDVIRSSAVTSNGSRALCRTAMKVTDDSMAVSTLDRQADYLYFTV
jgi:hypothetical protein